MATSSGHRQLMFSSVLPRSSEMRNLLLGFVIHSVIVFSCESRRIGSSRISNSEQSNEALSGSKDAGQAQKKEELLGQDTVKLNDAEYKLQSLVSPEFHSPSNYFQKPMKQIGDLQLDTLSQAQVNFLQSSSQWPQYSEPKDSHQGNLYPENPVPFPMSKGHIEEESHPKPWWDASIADSLSKDGLESPGKSDEGDSQGDSKSWWGSDKDYSNGPNDSSMNYQSYAVDDDKWGSPKGGSLNMQGSPKFSVNRVNPMGGNPLANEGNRLPMLPGNAIGNAKNRVGFLNGNPLLGAGTPRNLMGSEENKLGFFGEESSPLLDSYNSFTGRKNSWARQVKNEKQGILEGLQEAASMVDGDGQGKSFSTMPLFGDSESKANTRSLDGASKKHAPHEPQKTKHI